jgi:hypothetical protein
MRVSHIMFYGVAIGGLAFVARGLEAAQPSSSAATMLLERASADQRARAAAFRLKALEQSDAPSAGYATFHRRPGERPLPI